jgi:putative endonuclease
MSKRTTSEAWLLYVLRCRDGTLYCGITTDLDRRLAAHAAGRGARYTRGRGPLTLLRAWTLAGEGEARSAEARFKQLTRRRKLRALAEDTPFGDAVARDLELTEIMPGPAQVGIDN